MSNYLDNLVLRNQQAIEVVRPRLPSIFEPPAAMPFTSSTLHRVVQLESHQPPDDSTVPTALNEPGEVTTQREGEPLMLIKLENQARMPDPPAARAIPAWRGVQVIEEAQTMSVPPIPTEHSGRMLSVDTKERQTERHQSEPDMRQESLSHSSLIPPRQEQIAGAASSTDTAERRIVVQPRVIPIPQAANDKGNDDSDRHRSRREPFVQQTAEPSRPTINVTIGRIEIKAIPPATATTQTRKPKPSLMSLDEYMRRRNAGGDSR